MSAVDESWWPLPWRKPMEDGTVPAWIQIQGIQFNVYDWAAVMKPGYKRYTASIYDNQIAVNMWIGVDTLIELRCMLLNLASTPVRDWHSHAMLGRD